MYKRYLNKLSRTRLDDVLIDEGVLARSHIEDAQAESEMTGHSLSFVLFERDEIDEWELAKIVARNYSLPFVDVVAYSTPREAEVLLDLEFCRAHLAIPFDVFGQLPAVAVCEMPSAVVLEEIERRTGFTPFIYVTLRSRLLEELAAREESGVAPATAADAPPPPAVVGAAATTAIPGVGVASESDLEPASMRLGFNMHMRSGKTSRDTLPAPTGRPLPPAVPRRPAPQRVARPAPEVPFTAPAADAVDSDSTSAAEEKAAPAGKAAAWQSIFDLGDDAVS